MGTFGKTWVACSTHLTAADKGYTLAQSSQFLDISAFFTAQESTFSGGDFNLLPSDLNLWYWYWHEGDSTYQKPTKGSMKIDYIFGGKNRVDAYFGVSELKCGLPHIGSDHCFMRSVFQIP